MLSTGQTETQAHISSRLDYLPALDGLRAIAVIGVLLYHAELPLFKGGFLGVDVFFVISGYLITSLLIGEWNQTGKIDLRSFWLRRARRLLPALFLLLGVVLVFAVFFLHDEVATLRSDAVAAFGYVTNWYLIFNQQSYFETMGRPSLFQHLWSLAVEEQFYVIWPILFALLLKVARKIVLPLVLTGTLASAVLMALLYSPDVDPSRVYYGTDTRAAALLVGVALAFLLKRNAANLSFLSSKPWLSDIVGMFALATVLAFFVFADDSEAFLYLGGFLALELIVAVLISTIAAPGPSFLSRILGSSVPKWIGLRSYGIYLWHWPVFMVTRARVDVEIDGVPLFVLRVVITLAIAEISYRFVEGPIRHGALQRIWREIRTPGERKVSLFNLRIAVVLATLLILAGTIGPAIVSARPPDAPDFLSTGSINTIDPDFDSSADPTEEPTPEEDIEPSFEVTATEFVVATATSTQTPMQIPTATPALVDTPIVEATATNTIAFDPTANVNLISTTTPVIATSPLPTATLTPLPAESNLPSVTATVAADATATPPESTGTLEPTVTSEPALPTTYASAEPILPPTVQSGVTETATLTPGPGANPSPSGTVLPVDITSLGRIVAIGDSVMLGAAKELMRVIPGIAVDAKVSRQTSATISLLTAYKASGVLSDVVIIHIGNNGSITTKQFDQMMGVLTDTKWVIFVNLSVPRKWEGPNNMVLDEGAKRYSNVVVVDWHDDSVNHRDYFANDGYHLQVKGQREYAALILAKLKSLVPPQTPTPVASPHATSELTPTITPEPATATPTVVLAPTSEPPTVVSLEETPEATVEPSKVLPTETPVLSIP